MARAREDITEALDWVRVLAHSNPEYRERLIREIKKAVAQFSALGEGNPDKSAGRALSETFFNPEEYEIVGFAPNVSYVKAKAPSREELEALWVHPWGSATLLLKHKKLPFVVMINPGIRMGKSYLKEMPVSREHAQEIRGLSG